MDHNPLSAFHRPIDGHAIHSTARSLLHFALKPPKYPLARHNRTLNFNGLCLHYLRHRGVNVIERKPVEITFRKHEEPHNSYSPRPMIRKLTF